MIDEKKLIKTLQDRIDVFVKQHPDQKNCEQVQVQQEFIHEIELAAADEVIIPIKIDGYAFDGMDELEEQINNAKQLNPKLKFRGCLVTMFYNRDVCRQGEEWLQNQRYPVFKTHIRRTEKADEVTFTNESLMEYSPRSGAARDYKAFVREYLEV